MQGAIFASIGLSALQLPNMNAVHWSARACFSSSMVLGLASVFTATRQHQTVGMLNSPLDIRLWLSRGRPTLYRRFLEIQSSRLLSMNMSWGEFLIKDGDKYARLPAFRGLPLESSISALQNDCTTKTLTRFSSIYIPCWLWTVRFVPMVIRRRRERQELPKRFYCFRHHCWRVHDLRFTHQVCKDP